MAAALCGLPSNLGAQVFGKIVFVEYPALAYLGAGDGAPLPAMSFSVSADIFRNSAALSAL